MPEQRYIITHKDGREFSVTKAGFESLYQEQGFKLGREEVPADFVVTGVPKPKRKRLAPRAKEAAPVVEPVPLVDESATPPLNWRDQT